MVVRKRKIFVLDRLKQRKQNCFDLSHLVIKNIRINTNCTMTVHKFRFNVTFYKLGGYFHMYNRTKLRGIDSTSFRNK